MFLAHYLLISLLFLGSKAYEYCSNGKIKSLCKLKGKTINHFECEKEVQLPAQGDFKGIYPMTNKLIDYILYQHNVKRNQVASGQETGKGGVKYPRASRMRELIWDRELEYSCTVHVRQCNFEHDHCHNTPRFVMAGQNLGFMAGNRTKEIGDGPHMNRIQYVLEYSFNAWYQEKDLVDDTVRMAKVYHSDLKGVGHFTTWVNDQVSRVGCAVAFCKYVTYSELMEFNYLYCCNYDFGNVIKYPVYIQSTNPEESATDCAHWNTTKSIRNRHLCANSGGVFPAEFEKLE